jgi:hypothetical protein
MGMLVNGTSHNTFKYTVPTRYLLYAKFLKYRLIHLNCEKNLCFTVHVMLLTQQSGG